MMMYRNPAVALMPDLTPKPLRSKANGIINIMGYIGGAFATVVGIIFVLSNYLPGGKQEGQLWVIELPFIIASVLMVVSCVVLFVNIKENKIKEEIKDELDRGEKLAEVEVKLDENNTKMDKKNKIALLLILGAVFFWFMADNGIATFMGNYTIYHLGASSQSNMINTIVGGVGSVAGFAVGGIIASKIGRKWTVVSGLALTLLSYLVWAILNYTILAGSAGGGNFPIAIYFIWLIKGFGMSLVHVNSFPMVVELCTGKDIGRFTGYYYAASMAAQTITPVALGSLLLTGLNWNFLPFYGLGCLAVAAVIFMFVKNINNSKTTFSKGLEAFDQD